MGLKRWWRAVSVLASLFLLTFFFGCASGESLRLPFSASQVERIEIYRFVVPAEAEKKTIASFPEIQEICGVFTSLRVKENTLEPAAGGQVVSFRFYLDDGSKFEMVYVSPEHGIGELKAEGFDCQTTADLSAIWDDYGGSETISAPESDLPAIALCS